MTNRQRHLVDYLKGCLGYVKQEEILKDLGLFYGAVESGKSVHDSRARRSLTADIRAIREEGTYCIVSSGKGIRLGSKAEAIAFHANRVRRFGKYIQTEKNILKEFGLEGQYAYDGAVKEFVEGNG